MNGKLKTILIITIFVFMISMMAFAWPLNLLKINKIYENNDSEQSVTYKTLSDKISIQQYFKAQSDSLESVELVIGNKIDYGKDGYLTVKILNQEKEEKLVKNIAYSDLLFGKTNKIHINAKLKTNSKYILELCASEGTYLSIGILKEKDDISNVSGKCFYNSSKIKGGLWCNYVFDEDYNMMQTLSFWIVCMMLCLLLVSVIRNSSIRDIFVYLKTPNVLIQIWLIFFLISIFNLNAYVSTGVKNRPSLFERPIIVCIWLVTILVGNSLFLYAKKKLQSTNVRIVLRENIPLLSVMLISILLRIPMLHVMQRWDAGEYYYRLGTACQNYEFTFRSFFENFRLCTHSNLGFSFFMGMAEFLTPRNSTGVLVWNLILTVLAIGCIYELLQKHWLKSSRWEAALTTLVVSFTPSFVGTFAYFNIDYFLLIIFIYLVYCEYKKKYILMAFFAVIFSQAKETGVVVLAGYLGVELVIKLIRKKGNVIQRFDSLFVEPQMWIACFSAIVYCVEIIILGDVSGWKQNSDDTIGVTWSNNGFNCFGFQPEYILYKIKQLFVINFSWLLLLILIVSLIILIVSKKEKQKEKIKNIEEVVNVLAALLFFCVFSILYITYTLPRYNILFNVLFGMVVLCLLYHTLLDLQKNTFYIITIGIVGSLMLIQSFWNIDIISSKCFETVTIGSNTMLFSSYNQRYYGDGLVTNYQYTWLDNTFDELLQSIDYSSKKSIILTEKESSGMFIGGNPGVYQVGWDSNQQKRVYVDDTVEDRTVIKQLTEYDIFTQFPYKNYPYEELENLPLQGVLLFIPYYEEDEEILVKQYANVFHVSPRKSITRYGGNISYYEVIKQAEYNGFSLQDISEKKSSVIIGESVLEKEFLTYMKREGWNWGQVEDYYQYLNCKSLNIKKYNSEKNKVSKGDVISMTIVAYDENGKEIPQEITDGVINHSCRDVVVGNNLLLDIIDNSLIGCNINESIEITLKVPEDYYDLFSYATQNIILVITPTEISGYIDDNDLTEEIKKDNYNEAFDTVWEYYLNKVLKKCALQSITLKKVDNDEKIAKEFGKINRYFENYFIASGIQEEDYLNEYVNLDEKEFDSLKIEMAKTSLQAKRYKKVIAKRNGQIKKRLFSEGMLQIYQ